MLHCAGCCLGVETRVGSQTVLLFNAAMDLWWTFAARTKRLQLIPAIALGKEPGDKMIEGVGFQLEDSNDVLWSFFAKVLAQREFCRG